MFGGTADASRRVYALSRQVIGLGRAVAPLPAIMDRLLAEEPDLDPEHELDEDMRTYLRCSRRSSAAAGSRRGRGA